MVFSSPWVCDRHLISSAHCVSRPAELDAHVFPVAPPNTPAQPSSVHTDYTPHKAKSCGPREALSWLRRPGQCYHSGYTAAESAVAAKINNNKAMQNISQFFKLHTSGSSSPCLGEATIAAGATNYISQDELL